MSQTAGKNIVSWLNNSVTIQKMSVADIRPSCHFFYNNDSNCRIFRTLLLLSSNNAFIILNMTHFKSSFEVMVTPCASSMSTSIWCTLALYKISLLFRAAEFGKVGCFPHGLEHVSFYPLSSQVREHGGRPVLWPHPLWPSRDLLWHRNTPEGTVSCIHRAECDDIWPVEPWVQGVHSGGATPQ